MSERLAINAVQPGMVILRITAQNGPVKIKKSGLVTSDDMIRGLSEMGVTEVEIDPEQTVELEAEQTATTTTTQTQALLRGQYDRQGHYDNQLADQFNRSLFLPSVQGIPSIWMVYARQSLVVFLTLVLGGSIGFGAATYSLWLPNGNQVEHTVAQDTPAPVDSAATSSGSDELTLEPTNTIALDEPDNVQDTAQDNLANVQPKDEEVAAAPVDDFDVEEGRPLTPQGEADTDTSQVSPELLRRFNQAIESLDQSAGEPSNDTVVTVRNDVKRIDQLPVRLMTTLPSMTFTAHMYASRPNDRWVRVNGNRLQEGDWIDNEVRIVNIEAQRVILEYRDELFSMAALTDW